MKELSIEEKARRYDEALKVLHKYDGANIMFSQSLKEEMFPELKKSEEDERTWIINYLSNRILNSTIIAEKENLKKAIAWLGKQGENTHNKELSELLHKVICRFINDPNIPYTEREKVSMEIIPYVERLEKQGEQKPADKVEPKFHEGDWVVSELDGKARQISEVCCDKYNNYYVVKGKKYDIEDYDRLHYLWTIQDAKDGDVLATLDYILIFKEFLKNDGGISYCHYDFGAGNPQFIWLEDKNWYFGKEAIIHPATKEQRELLYQKMHEAGYEWDAEKLELKKIEEKPAEWCEEDERMLDSIIASVTGFDSTTGTIIARFEEHEKKIAWLKSLKDRVQPQNTWKPSESDILLLERIVNGKSNPQDFQASLCGLIEQLKKLKG